MPRRVSPRSLTIMAAAAAAMTIGLLVAGCAGDQLEPEPTSPVSSTAAPVPTVPVATASPATGKPSEPKLRRELLAMLAADQKSRMSADSNGAVSDQARTARLQEIIDDGATAAWAITQHSDLDPEFQRQALPLLEQAVRAGEASAGIYAYLVDRVAANADQPQTFGTQMGCGADGKPQLRPLVDPGRIEQLRAEAGLPTMADYLAELEKVCAGS